MTPDEARAFCDDLQERVTQMGERTGEGLHLGRCLSVIRGLASQVDALTPPVDEVVDEVAAPMDPIGTTRKVSRARKGDQAPRLDE